MTEPTEQPSPKPESARTPDPAGGGETLLDLGTGFAPSPPKPADAPRAQSAGSDGGAATPQPSPITWDAEVGPPSMAAALGDTQTLISIHAGESDASSAGDPASTGDAPTRCASQATTRILPAVPPLGGARYELKEELGRGGMGVVLRAFDRDLRRNVALKIARADRRTTSQSMARFIDEAQVTGQLSHPNIPPVHELGLDPRGRPYFTMKLVEGRSLAQVVRKLRSGDEETRREFPIGRRLYIFGQLLHGIAYAHDRGVIHRDLKPDNIMLGDYGEVLVMDWGLARVLGNRPATEAEEAREIEPETARESAGPVTTYRDETPGSRTLDGEVVGTPAYMSPEQARGEQARIDRRSDIYSLGAILYELLALHAPYTASSVTELIRKVAHERPPRPIERNPKAVIPAGVEAVCMRCLEREPEKRFQSVKDLQSALDSYHEAMAESADEGLLFALIGKVFVLSVAASLFLLTALVLSGSRGVDWWRILDPGGFASLMTLGFGTLFAWWRLGPKTAFDATHAVLLWERGNVRAHELRGFFAAEACRRAKWCYLLPSLGAVAAAAALQTADALNIAVQMLAAGSVAALAVNVVEQGTYRRLDAIDEVSGQDRLDTLWRVLLVAAVLAAGIFYMRLTGWDFRIRSLQDDFRRGTLAIHVMAVLGGLWVLAQISYPFREVNNAMGALLFRRLDRSTRRQLAPMARVFASNAVLFGALGSLTWFVLHAPAPGWWRASAAQFAMGLTPMIAGLGWSWFFRIRSGRLMGDATERLRTRYAEYLGKPETPDTGFSFYVAAWAPFLLGGFVSLAVFALRVLL